MKRSLMMMLLASALLLLEAAAGGDAAEPTIAGHTVKLDSQGKIIPWHTPAENAYSEFLHRRWNFIKAKVPPSPGPAPRSDYPQYFFYDGYVTKDKEIKPDNWMNDVGEKIPNWFESARLYQFTGDEPKQLGDLERATPRRGHHHSAGLWRRVLLPVTEHHSPKAACVPLAEVWHAAFRPWKMAATPRESARALDAGGRNGTMKARESLEWFQAQRIREMSGHWRGSYRAGLAQDESLLIRAEPSSMDGVLRSVPHPTSFTSTALALVHKDYPPCPKTASPRVAGFCRVLPPSARPVS